METLDANTLTFILKSASSTSTMLAILGALGMILLAFALVSKLGEKILPKPTETRLSNFLPFESIDADGATIRLRNGALARVFEVKGLDVTLLLPEDREALTAARKRWVDSMAELEVVCRVITVRDRVQLAAQEAFADNKMLKEVENLWMKSMRRVYKNKHYIVLSINDRKDAVRDLDQASNALLSILDMYEPVLVSEHATLRQQDKSPMWLFARLASPLTRPKPFVHGNQGDSLNMLLTADYVHFTKDEGIIRFFSGDREKLGIVMGVRKPGDFMDEQMIADLLSIDVELTCFHNIKAISVTSAMKRLWQQQRMAYATSFSQSVQEQYQMAMEMLDSNDADAQTLNEYALSIILYADSKEELKFGQEEVERICRIHNVTPIREGWAAQAVFFSQFPTYEIYPRTYLYFSRVIGCAVMIDQPTEGRQKSDWGPVPLAYFKTITGTPYAFQFHVTEDPYAVAHTALIGPTGQGKTTFFSFIAGQAMRIPDLRTYFFDRNNGAKVFALMNGSPYVKFDGGEDSVSLNPFMMNNTAANRTFLRGWLKDITGCDDAISEAEIARAVTTAFDYLPKEDRMLRNLYKACFAPNSVMRRELNRWIDPEQYGRIFNSVDDTLDLSRRYVAFDFTSIFNDSNKSLAPAIISYIMQRIDELATSLGAPSMIMIDETAPMLEHPMFRSTFVKGLQEGRKKRQAYLCAFQQPKLLEEIGMGGVVRGQCQTQIFFRNSGANASDYDSWGLTPRELNFILGKEWDNHKYAILVKRSQVKESVILDVDLSGLGPYLKVYSSGSKNVLLAEQLSKEISDTDALVQAYLKRA